MRAAAPPLAAETPAPEASERQAACAVLVLALAAMALMAALAFALPIRTPTAEQAAAGSIYHAERFQPEPKERLAYALALAALLIAPPAAAAALRTVRLDSARGRLAATAAALAAVVLGVTLSQLAAGPCMARAVRPREL